MSTVTETTPIEPHWAHSERLMRHAFEQLANDDRLQASEKAWGAMAHTLKAIAEERRLAYERHTQAWDVVYAVLEDVADPTRRQLIRGGFAMAENLHRNFYEDVHRRECLDHELEQVQGAIALLHAERDLWRGRQG